MSCGVLLEDEHSHRSEQRSQRNPERGAEHVVAVYGALAGAHIVRSHVHHVALLQVEHRRRRERLGIAEVDGVDLLLIARGANHLHVFATAVDGEVAGSRQSIENGEVVAVDGITSRASHFAHNADGEVGIFHNHHRVAEFAAFDDAGLDVVGHLRARHAGDVQFAKNREVDVAVSVDGIHRDAAAGVRGVAADSRRALAEAVGDVWQVERHSQLGVVAVHHNRQFVARLHLYLVVISEAERGAVVHVLKIFNLLWRAARSENRHCCSNEKMLKLIEIGYFNQVSIPNNYKKLKNM